MTSPILCNFWGNEILQQYLTANGAYLGLHISSPGVTGDPTTEYVGGGYHRQLCHFSAPGSKTVATINAQTFSGLVAGSFDWLVLWTTVAGGNALCAIPIPLQTISASGQWISRAGDIALGL